ncbi:NUDIX domain-containing protein [Paenibacillus sp. SI8]|uniref:NUDIX hydrolase n=1 Tax=unclassified Paenibacillus TaxID=185978 RepID=UPI0034673D51
MLITYNICFVRRNNEILLLNRDKPSWMGCWNGIGGKVEQGEQPRTSMEREIGEETGISAYVLHFKGLVTWRVDGAGFGGMYLYVAQVDSHLEFATPLRMNEGILDWKHIDWIMHDENLGIATNLPKCLDIALKDSVPYDHHCIYEKGRLVAMSAHQIDASMEWDSAYRQSYLEKYM